MATRQLPDWGVDPVVYPASKKLALMALLAGPVVLLLIGLVVFKAGWFLVPVVVWVAFLLANHFRSTKRTALQGKTLTPANDARFENLVRGLATQHGLSVPELLVIEEGGPNAVVLTRPPRLAVTRSLLETFTLQPDALNASRVRDVLALGVPVATMAVIGGGGFGWRVLHGPSGDGRPRRLPATGRRWSR